jgi:hypothetical protein
VRKIITYCLIVIVILTLFTGCTSSNLKETNKEVNLELKLGENVLYTKEEPSLTVINKDKEKELICDNLPSVPVISPDKKRMVYITPFEFECIGEVYMYDADKNENKVIISSKDYESQHSAFKVYWLDDRYLLVIIGYAYGTVHVGGDLYIYDTLDDKFYLYIEAEDKKEVKDVKVYDKYVTVYYALFNDDFTEFRVEEETISKEKLYNFTKYKLTIKDIKKKYNENEIVEIKKYKDKYILVESKRKNEVNNFDFYNLETGDWDRLFNDLDYMILLNIKNENELVFLSNGLNNESGFHGFPYIVKFIRYEENPEYDFGFKRIKEKAYFQLYESILFGNKGDAVISDLKITLDGIEVLFKPQVGKEAGFYADYTNIPVTKTAYNKKRIN